MLKRTGEEADYVASLTPCACAGGLRTTVVCLCVCVSVCYRSSCSSVDLHCPTSIATESAPYFKGF